MPAGGEGLLDAGSEPRAIDAGQGQGTRHGPDPGTEDAEEEPSGIQPSARAAPGGPVNRELERGAPTGDSIVERGCWRQAEGAERNPCARKALLEFTVERRQEAIVIQTTSREDPLGLGASVGGDRQEDVLGLDAG